MLCGRVLKLQAVFLHDVTIYFSLLPLSVVLVLNSLTIIMIAIIY